MKGEPPNDEMVKPSGPEQPSTTLLEGAVMTEIQLGAEVIKLCFHLSEQFKATFLRAKLHFVHCTGKTTFKRQCQQARAVSVLLEEG